jgi:hypothetical protein
MPGYNLDLAPTASFQISSSILLTNYSTIRRYTILRFWQPSKIDHNNWQDCVAKLQAPYIQISGWVRLIMLWLYSKWSRNQYRLDLSYIKIFPSGLNSPVLLQIIYNLITYEELRLFHSVVASTQAIWTSYPTSVAELYQIYDWLHILHNDHTEYHRHRLSGICEIWLVPLSCYFLISVLVPRQHKLGFSNKTRLQFLNLWFRNSLPEVVWRGGSGPPPDLASVKIHIFGLHAV